MALVFLVILWLFLFVPALSLGASREVDRKNADRGSQVICLQMTSDPTIAASQCWSAMRTSAHLRLKELVRRLGSERWGAEAARKLVGVGQSCVPYILGARLEFDSPEFGRAVDVLARIGETAVKPLVSALSDETESAHLVAIYALGKIGRGAVAPLIVTLSHETWWVRVNAAAGLRQTMDPRAVCPLIEALSDPNPRVRASAALALGRIADQRAVQALVGSLSDADTYVRLQACFALGVLKDLRALGPLQELSEDPDASVRHEALEAIHKLIGGVQVAGC